MVLDTVGQWCPLRNAALARPTRRAERQRLTLNQEMSFDANNSSGHLLKLSFEAP